MYFQILKIVLWPIDQSKNPRELVFHEGRLNVITGASRTGKSSLIPIIDFCLGSSSCNIPVDIIRNSCSWFGIVIKANDTQYLFARRNIESNPPSNDTFVLRGTRASIPMTIDEPNSNVEGVKSILNSISGIPALRIDADESGGGFQSSVSFRDLISFNFQPQNIVANQNVLFYKTDTYKYRERLINVFPFALGVITAQILLLQFELKKLRLELKRKEKYYDELYRISMQWQEKIQQSVSKAIEYGLWPDKYSSNSNDVPLLVSILREICTISELDYLTTYESISNIINKLKQLKITEGELSRQLAELRNSLSELNRIQLTFDKYSEVAALKRDRLKISEFFLATNDSSIPCPICGNEHYKSAESINDIYKVFKNLEDSAQSPIEIPPAYYRELAFIKNDISDKIKAINAVRHQINKLELSTKEQKTERYKRESAIRFLGILQNQIENYDEVNSENSLSEEIEQLKIKIKKLNEKVSQSSINKKKTTSLNKISGYISEILPSLDVERTFSQAPCSLEIKDLNLQIHLEDGQSHYLSQIGSGSNWVSYHIALTIALHRFFSDGPTKPVASFIVYDQPSQVYFPRKLADEGKTNEGNDTSQEDWGEKFTDEDVEAVRKIFEAIANAINADEGKWQAIVLDHAPASVWENIKGVVLVDKEWRDGVKLIPADWYS